MLDLESARRVLEQAMPDDDVRVGIEYENLFIFQVFNTRPYEEDLDPFYSVDRETGNIQEFSILTDGDILVITEKFEAAL